MVGGSGVRVDIHRSGYGRMDGCHGHGRRGERGAHGVRTHRFGHASDGGAREGRVVHEGVHRRGGGENEKGSGLHGAVVIFLGADECQSENVVSVVSTFWVARHTHLFLLK